MIKLLISIIVMAIVAIPWLFFLCRDLARSRQKQSIELPNELLNDLENANTLLKAELRDEKKEPNKKGKKRIITFDDLYKQVLRRHQSLELPIIAGLDLLEDGYLGSNPQIFDLADSPHLIVAGASGYGKSNFLRCLINSLLLSKTDVYLYLIDPEEVEFSPYEDHPKTQMVTTLKDVEKVVSKNLREEIERRRTILKNHKAVKIGELTKKEGTPSLARIILVIDEFANFAKATDFQDALQYVARVGRKYGIHIVLCTQRPSAKIIDEQTRAQFVNVLSFKIKNTKGSAEVIGIKEVTTLKEKGEAYFLYQGNTIKLKPPFLKSHFSKALKKTLKK